MLGEGLLKRRQIILKQRQEVCIIDIACTQQQKPLRAVIHQKGVHEVIVLGKDDAVISVRDVADFIVGRTVTARQVKGVDRLVTSVSQVYRQPSGQLGVNQKLHAASLLPSRLT